MVFPPSVLAMLIFFRETKPGASHSTPATSSHGGSNCNAVVTIIINTTRRNQAIGKLRTIGYQLENKEEAQLQNRKDVTISRYLLHAGKRRKWTADWRPTSGCSRS